MKILNPYRFIKGGSGAPEVFLMPPRSQNLRKSISIAEIVDILCEGPIYGLVDQFGRKIYGLDMLKGVYLNGVPVMNTKGEYNFRNILMEINFGTENQKPLPSFKKANIPKGMGFKLLGPIKTTDSGDEIIINNRKGGNFVDWAKSGGDWPSEEKDPFVFVHKIKNKDVKKLKVGLVIEALSDTVDYFNPNLGGKNEVGTFLPAKIKLLLKYGLENSSRVQSRIIEISGTATSPFSIMIGEGDGGDYSDLVFLPNYYSNPNGLQPSARGGGALVGGGRNLNAVGLTAQDIEEIIARGTRVSK